MSASREARTVRIELDDAAIDGDLTLAADSSIVVFAHGSGSSRHSPRNRHVAAQLHEDGLGTLLIDLLTAAEEEVDLRTRELRFDVALLARRLGGATDWLSRNEETASLRIGYFGASTGAAAALIAAADRPEIGAVVSRGGRPDLAGAALGRVRAPTLLIVGGADVQVLEVNRRSLELLQAERRLEVVARATHLFEEPGALDQVAHLAGDWFSRYLAAGERAARAMSRLA